MVECECEGVLRVVMRLFAGAASGAFAAAALNLMELFKMCM